MPMRPSAPIRPPAIPSSGIPPRPSKRSIAPRKSRLRRIRQTCHPRRIHHDMPISARAARLAAQIGFIPQRQVDHAAFAAVHRIEAERVPRALHLLRHRRGAQPQFLDAQRAIVVGIERNARVILGGHAQRLHGHVLQGQQQFSAVGQQILHVRAGELHHHVGRLEVVVSGLAIGHLVAHAEARLVETRTQKLLYPGTYRRNRVLARIHRLLPAIFLFLQRLHRLCRHAGQRRFVEKILLRDTYQVAGQIV